MIIQLKWLAHFAASRNAIAVMAALAQREAREGAAAVAVAVEINGEGQNLAI